ncbi:hypothetical protein IB234_15100 [Pseudomonas sp. PDM16]|uniref:hypothetical protein n=1 Tax=Pseudomonas sp. PDM16 TaxID=2769292 RepID=UPI0017851092|nr:hypothetical protein [Pseudomonas sp. PDM16]MBD9415888.1 hypothetical protein [Pseudomonas sp. PDM16]
MKNAINLAQPGALTLDSVRALIGAYDDSTHTQLRVTKEGVAFISTSDIGGRNIKDLAFRFETFQAGGGFVGRAAAADDAWVKRLYEALKKNWPTPSKSYIDSF